LVFQPFHRTKDPAFKSVPGTGLGLYISHKLAEVNRGMLTLERTEPGVGSCFALDLPLARSKPLVTTANGEKPRARGS
ncbi:MAG: hypothetical protein E6I92_12625, partial [Chloroflexi bacterium]